MGSRLSTGTPMTYGTGYGAKPKPVESTLLNFSYITFQERGYAKPTMHSTGPFCYIITYSFHLRVEVNSHQWLVILIHDLNHIQSSLENWLGSINLSV